MPKFHRHRGYNRNPGPAKALSGAIWLIGIGVLMMTGDWWPGILFLVGLSMIVETVFRAGKFAPEIENDEAPFQPAPTPRPMENAPTVVPNPTESIPAVYNYRSDLLPGKCPRCGGPTRSAEVKWLSSRSANCAYCGSALPMKRE